MTGLTEGSIGHKVPLVRPQKAGALPSAIKPSRGMGGRDGKMEKREGAACKEGFKSMSRKKSLRQAKRAI